MSALPKHRRLTAAEYLAIEDAAEFRSEFYDGEMFLMAGTAVPHNDLKDNLSDELGARLRGSGCRKATNDQRVLIPTTGLYTYPDIVVTCGPREFDPLSKITLTNPTLVVEVLSPGTASYDRGAKLRQYQRLASLRVVLLAASDRVQVDVYSREPDGRWVHTVFDDPAGELVIPGLPVPVRIPLADVYRDVELPDEPPLRDHTPDDQLPGYSPPAAG